MEPAPWAGYTSVASGSGSRCWCRESYSMPARHERLPVLEGGEGIVGLSAGDQADDGASAVTELQLASQEVGMKVRQNVIINHCRELALHQWEKYSLDAFAHPAIFHRRFAYDSGLINRLLVMRDAGDVKDRKLLFERVIPRVISKRPFHAAFARINIALRGLFQHSQEPLRQRFRT